MGSVIDRFIPQRYWAWAACAIGAAACLAAASLSPLWFCPPSPSPSSRSWGSWTSRSRGRPSGATTRSSRTSASSSSTSAPRSASTSSRPTPTTRPSRARSARSSTSAPRASSTSAPSARRLDFYEPHYEWINHSIAPREIESHDFRIAIGEGRVAKPYSASVFNISAMSFGALSANAVLALNEGARRGRFFHDTGEGSISRYHREPGGDLVWEIGSGYFGCRDDEGRFNEERFVANATSRPGEDDRGEALAGRQARPRRRAARRQGDPRDRRGAPRAGGRRLHLARAALGLLHAHRAAAVRRAGCARSPAASPRASSSPSATRGSGSAS